MQNTLTGLVLPQFPWDTLAQAKKTASAHEGGIVDLSIGTPVDSTPKIVRDALIEAADAPGYPTVVGTQELAEAIRVWALSRGISMMGQGASAIPTIGSKEMVAWLPTMLGVGPGDRVLIPKCAYPTYDIGARLAGAEPVPVGDDPEQWPDAKMVWLNTPGNPNGHVRSVEQLRDVVQWARQRGAVVASDECYAALGWSETLLDQGVPSLLSDAVSDSDPNGLLMLYSLSKQSNMAGYRAGILAGDSRLVDAVVAVRKHAGMMVSTPVMHAMSAALRDSAPAFANPRLGLLDEEAGLSHVARQRGIYAKRRAKLVQAFERAGLKNDPESIAGLYLWLHAPGQQMSGRQIVDKLAQLGILVAPGDFYGEGNEAFVRVSLSGTDERIDAAVCRLNETNGYFTAK
ncbi:MAG: succinyldiaminopimelate transaminase [Actinomycetaceae bacterium]|nr:succinyldiaminopimelate transaminase [Actinomycetaceae bacterium]